MVSIAVGIAVSGSEVLYVLGSAGTPNLVHYMVSRLCPSPTRPEKARTSMRTRNDGPWHQGVARNQHCGSLRRPLSKIPSELSQENVCCTKPKSLGFFQQNAVSEPLRPFLRACQRRIGAPLAFSSCNANVFAWSDYRVASNVGIVRSPAEYLAIAMRISLGATSQSSLV